MRVKKVEDDQARLTEPEVKEMWDSLVETEATQLYISCQLRLRLGIDQWAKIIILVSSLSCVATWKLVSEHPFYWQTVTVIIAAISIIQVVLDFAGRANEMAKVNEKLIDLHCEYDELFRSLPDITRREAKDRYNLLKRSEKPITESIAKLHYWARLHRRCFAQACQARELGNPLDKNGNKNHAKRNQA